ncbi:aminotransferase class I and II [Pedobacter psychrophilus]|uniref:Aminotransferase class I and II n=1 Tax=Pedobacter psychrophilus TaxID=1826909 RepID=A0A179DEU5_9SPHI|nr:HipA family kinase [Pedobacter psychrophilus]OAQ39567.1 aminotransferase class I and II [Pedobacter psychrophilus]
MAKELVLRRVNVDRYVTPLREGGSMPAIIEGDDGFLYVLKFRGAGQGTKALIAELIGGEIARKLGFNVPELVFADLDEAFGRTEPDEEIQDLLKFSTGLNLGLHYLSGSITYDPGVSKIDETLASKIVWLDALLMNMDRTAKNPNMLVWNKDIWLIDHGAALYFHHSWDDYQKSSLSPFPLIKDHILLAQATNINEVSLELSEILDSNFIEEVVQLIPDDWLNGNHFDSTGEFKKAYAFFLNNRIKNAHIFVKSANDAREKLI